MQDKNTKYLIVLGNVTFGFAHIGPFDLRDDAVSWAENNIKANPWSVCELIPNETFFGFRNEL